jgi:hypothetical protein
LACDKLRRYNPGRHVERIARLVELRSTPWKRREQYQDGGQRHAAARDLIGFDG